MTTFCLYFGFGLVTPVVPLLARDLGASAALAGFAVAAFGVASFCFDLAGGRLSGRIGVRRAAAGGALLIGAAALLAGVSSSVGVLMASRFLTGAGSAIYVTTAMNILSRTTPPERMGRAMSTYQGAILLGVAVGPSVGGLLSSAAGLRLPFFLYAGVGVASALVSLALLPAELPPPRTAGGSSGRLGAAARDSAFLTALAVAFVVFILRQGVNSTAVPLYAHETLGLGRGQVGLALSVSALSNVLFLTHAGRLADRRPRGVSISLGLGATLVALALLGLWQSVPGLFAGMFVLGCATAYAGVTPAALVADVTPAASSATAMGVYRMAVDLGSVTGPLMAGVLTGTTGHAPAFLLMAVPALLTLAAALRLRDTRPAPLTPVPTPVPTAASPARTGSPR